MDILINDDFLLTNEISKKLYHDYAENMPIIDYHCHIDPKDIAEDRKYGTITELWLGTDHYKWRAMRTNGVDEDYITGGADPREKFRMWAYTMEYLIGNPLFHWTQLEMKRYFGIDEILSRSNCDRIYDEINEKLESDEFSCRKIIARSGVEAICTTDDPLSRLEHHEKIACSGFGTRVLPSFRPDKFINIESAGYLEYIVKCEEEFDVRFSELEMLLELIEARIEYFHKAGCRVSDHALEPPVQSDCSAGEVMKIYQRRLKGETLSGEDIAKYKTLLIDFLGRHYAARDWAMQIHTGGQRNLNSVMYSKLGADTGYDAIDDTNFARGLARILDMLEKSDSLPKTIIYCLNPRDNDMISSVTGAFQKAPNAGKIQFGSAWWFNDTRTGMEKQMKALASTGLLSRFIGMLTDSRSFLSYTRHEYFRRILCEMLGKWAYENEIPKDMDLLGRMVRDISYNNAKNFFNISCQVSRVVSAR